MWGAPTGLVPQRSWGSFRSLFDRDLDDILADADAALVAIGDLIERKFGEE